MTYLFPCILSSAVPNALGALHPSHESRVYLAVYTSQKPRMLSLVIPRHEIRQRPARATRMHRLFKSCLQRLMRGRRVESPSIRCNGNGGDTNHDNHSGCDLALSSAWGAANVALQSWLGLLSQQRLRSHRCGPRDSVAPRALMRAVALTLLARL